MSTWPNVPHDGGGFAQWRGERPADHVSPQQRAGSASAMLSIARCRSLASNVLSVAWSTSSPREAEAALRASRPICSPCSKTRTAHLVHRSHHRLTASNSALPAQRDCLVWPCVGTRRVCLQLSDGETNAEWRSLYDRALAGERVAPTQGAFSRARGTWMEYRFSPVYDADGRIVGATVLSRNITARMMAAQQIEAQLAEISHYYDTALVGLAVLDTDLRLRAGQSAARRHERGSRWKNISARQSTMSCHLVAGPTAGKWQHARWPPARPSPVSRVIRWTPADQCPAYLKMNWHPIKDSDGTIIGFNAMVEDISERKQRRPGRTQRAEYGHMPSASVIWGLGLGCAERPPGMVRRTPTDLWRR